MISLMKKLNLIPLFIILLASANVYAFRGNGGADGEVKGNDFYKRVFAKLHHTKSHAIVDNISENPINKIIIEVFDKQNKRLGFYRNLITTTGCNSACLPIIATLFYSGNKSFLRIGSRDGLTKRNHAEMEDEDYRKLELILVMAPVEFNTVKHPKEMVDALTGETNKRFVPYVVKAAAYTSLRIHIYNQDTLGLLQKL